jgi:hypothetical protein
MTRHTYPRNYPICSVGGMTEPPTKLPKISANGVLARASEPDVAVTPLGEVDSDIAPTDDSPPSTPRWVKALGIILVVLLLAFAGLHLTGNAPTHMGGAGGMQHGLQLP